MAFRSENHGSFVYDLRNRGPMTQEMWHVKEPSLLKAESTMKPPDSRKIAGAAQNNQTKAVNIFDSIIPYKDLPRIRFYSYDLQLNLDMDLCL
jgi:hypothetical protein